MKNKTVYTCQSCSAQFPKWMGKCPECNQWNSLVEENYSNESAISSDSAKGHALFKKNLKDSVQKDAENPTDPQLLNEISESEVSRIPTNFGELNRALGGGIVPGSLVLIGGDPGIGKSTILMQGLTKNKILYVSAEESAKQIKLRASRLGIESESFFVFAENDFESILEQVRKIKPEILIIDSIQTIYSGQIQSAPGSISQVRECTARLMMTAKTLGMATFVVGHVTKEGSIAGPKVLEHMVDTVLYFEGSSHNAYRIVRAVKNRFGSTNEIGVFEMTSMGLREVSNPSEIFLQERVIQATGTTVVSAIEGSRPILVEIQALVSDSNLATPRRTTLGIDHNKVSLLVAVIEKKLGFPLYGHDLFVNVAGGIRLDEPAADLGAMLAIVSSYKNKRIHPKLISCGEVGLTGEVRRVTQLDQRLSEAAKLGFEYAIVPKGSYDYLAKAGLLVKGIKAYPVQTIQEAVNVVFEELA